MVTVLKLVHNAGARWDGRAEPGRHADGLRYFCFAGGCHVFPLLDEVTAEYSRGNWSCVQTNSFRNEGYYLERNVCLWKWALKQSQSKLNLRQKNYTKKNIWKTNIPFRLRQKPPSPIDGPGRGKGRGWKQWLGGGGTAVQENLAARVAIILWQTGSGGNRHSCGGNGATERREGRFSKMCSSLSTGIQISKGDHDSVLSKLETGEKKYVQICKTKCILCEICTNINKKKDAKSLKECTKSEGGKLFGKCNVQWTG